ncbi:MAG: hypothetical protein U5K54_16860 [Cytophagales bacterium]|nr:hypothetical protein [Cytophagales bacterium]
MRILIVLLGLILASCSPSSKPKEGVNEETGQTVEDFTLSSLAGDWHMVTQQDNEWVLFYPCDADNTMVSFRPIQSRLAGGRMPHLEKLNRGRLPTVLSRW